MEVKEQNILDIIRGEKDAPTIIVESQYLDSISKITYEHDEFCQKLESVDRESTKYLVFLYAQDDWDIAGTTEIKDDASLYEFYEDESDNIAKIVVLEPTNERVSAMLKDFYIEEMNETGLKIIPENKLTNSPIRFLKDNRTNEYLKNVDREEYKFVLVYTFEDDRSKLYFCGAEDEYDAAHVYDRIYNVSETSVPLAFIELDRQIEVASVDMGVER